MIDFSSMVDTSVEVYISLRDIIYSRELSFWNSNVRNIFFKDDMDKYHKAYNVISDIPELKDYFDTRRPHDEWLDIFKGHKYFDVKHATDFFKGGLVDASKVNGIVYEDRVMFMILAKSLLNRETLKASNVFFITDGYDDLFIPFAISKINKNNLITDEQFKAKIKRFNSNTQASIIIGESLLRQIAMEYEPASLTIDIISPSTDADKVNKEFDINIVSVQYANTITNI